MALSTESRFFGLDLTQIKADVLKTWRKAPQWPPLSWLQPEQALTLLPAEGEPRVIWENGTAAKGVKHQPSFWAVELPERMVLRKVLQLPSMESQDCISAAQLEAQAISPFPAEDLLWGCAELSRSSKSVRLQLVLASRAQVDPYVQEKRAEQQQMQGAESKVTIQPEAWVFAAENKPIVIQGFGETLRAQAGRKKLLVNIAGVCVAALLLMAIAITPTAQLRLRAIEAAIAHEQIVAKTSDVLAKREQLMMSADQVASLSAALDERIDMVKVLSMLTTTLSDDTALQTVRVQAGKLVISGMTDNTSSVMQKLSKQPGVSDVRAPSAATRLIGLDKEAFNIEALLDTKVFGLTLKVEEPVKLDSNAVPLTEDVNKTEAPPAAPVVDTSSTVPKRRGATLGGGAIVQPAASLNEQASGSKKSQ